MWEWDLGDRLDRLGGTWRVGHAAVGLMEGGRVDSGVKGCGPRLRRLNEGIGCEGHLAVQVRFLEWYWEAQLAD